MSRMFLDGFPLIFKETLQEKTKRAIGEFLGALMDMSASKYGGLTSRQEAVMFKVYTVDKHLRSIRIAEDLNLNRPAMSRAIATLEEKKLIARMPDPNDKRSFFILRTKAGEAWMRQTENGGRRLAILP